MASHGHEMTPGLKVGQNIEKITFMPYIVYGLLGASKFHKPTLLQS